MIISENKKPPKKDFVSLINLTLSELEFISKEYPSKILKMRGVKFEPYLKDIVNSMAKGTVFENSIQLIGGQKFPDIIAKKFYGIEVKTTTKDHWKTTGNSVLETTRVKGVENIYMFFAKLANPIQFKCKPYEDCLSEVVVTHSPRYLINMNLKEGETIFDKIDIPYNKLRKQKNPIKPIIKYYKKKLNNGEDLWWLDNNKSANLIIKLWNNIELKERRKIILTSMVFFPEIFSNQSNKFNRLAIWLVKELGIVCPNVRDSFTAGGKKNYSIGKNDFFDVPRIFINLFDNIESVLEIINLNSATNLSKYWDYKTSETNKISDWINLIGLYSKTITTVNHIDVKIILQKLIF